MGCRRRVSMIYNINKEAYKLLYGKGEADKVYEGARIALKQVELTQEALFKTFNGIRLTSDYKVFVVDFKNPLEKIKQIVQVTKFDVAYG